MLSGPNPLSCFRLTHAQPFPGNTIIHLRAPGSLLDEAGERGARL